jgi:hypothetical protein
VYESEGAGSLGVGYGGRQGSLSEAEQGAVIESINGPERLSVEALGD